MAKSKRNFPNRNRNPGKKTTTDIVRRHLSNKNDKITGEDFKNLSIDLSIPKDKAHEPLPIREGSERPKDAEKDHKTITPWDVINE